MNETVISHTYYSCLYSCIHSDYELAGGALRGAMSWTPWRCCRATI